MKEISTTYFCITLDEFRAMLSESGMDGLVAVIPSSDFSFRPVHTLPKFIDVLESKASFIIAPRDQDIAFVTAAGLWHRFLLAFKRPRAPLGPSLQKSPNAALLLVPSVDRAGLKITPGFVSSYPGKSEIYQRIKANLTKTMQHRDGFLVSPGVVALLGQGFKIWVS